MRRMSIAFAGSIVSEGQLALAEDLLTISEKFKITDAVGQSLGALSLTRAVSMNPDTFSNITLTHPAGMIKPDLGRLLPSGLQHAKAWWNRIPVKPENSIQRYVGRYQPVLPVRSPGNVAANGDNVILSYHAPLLESIKNNSAKPPHITIVAGKDDYIFSPSRMAQHIARTAIDQFIVVEGGHAIGDRRAVMDQVMHTLQAPGS